MTTHFISVVSQGNVSRITSKWQLLIIPIWWPDVPERANRFLRLSVYPSISVKSCVKVTTYSQSKHWGRLDKRANLHKFNELLGNVMLLLICIYDYFPFMLICDWKPQTINSNPNALCNSSKQHILLVKCCRTPKTFNTAFINCKRNFMPTGKDDAWGLTRSVFDKWCLSKQQ